MNEIYKRIRARREELGLSQEELAIKMGYRSRSSIHKIETGVNDIPQSKIEEFAKALDTTPGYLMGWEEDFGEYIKCVTKELEEKYSNYKNNIESLATNTLKTYFYQLNNKGREEAIKRVKELTYIPMYCRDTNDQTLNAAHAIDGATEEDKQHDDDIMDNDDLWK